MKVCQRDVNIFNYKKYIKNNKKFIITTKESITEQIKCSQKIDSDNEVQKCKNIITNIMLYKLIQLQDKINKLESNYKFIAKHNAKRNLKYITHHTTPNNKTNNITGEITDNITGNITDNITGNITDNITSNITDNDNDSNIDSDSTITDNEMNANNIKQYYTVEIYRQQQIYCDEQVNYYEGLIEQSNYPEAHILDFLYCFHPQIPALL